MSERVLIALAIFAAMVVLLSPVACTMNRHRLIAETMQKNPMVDPVLVRCAIVGSDDHSNLCVLKSLP